MNTREISIHVLEEDLTLEDFVVETTVYEVMCSKCKKRTEYHEDEEDALNEAKKLGYGIVDIDVVLCGECRNELGQYRRTFNNL